MRKTDARTVRSSGSLSIANDGSEPQFGRVKVPITLLFVDEPIKCGYSFFWNQLNILRTKLSGFGEKFCFA